MNTGGRGKNDNTAKAHHEEETEQARSIGRAAERQRIENALPEKQGNGIARTTLKGGLR